MAMAYGASSVVSTAGGTEIIPDLTNTRTVILYNNGTAIVYIGFDSSVTASNGIPLLPQSSFQIDSVFPGRRRSLFGIAASGTQDVRYMYWDT